LEKAKSDTGLLDDQAKAGTSLISRRKEAELAIRDNPFVLTPHKANYVLLATYNDTPNTEPYTAIDEPSFDHVEMKFQLSFKFPVVENLFDSNMDLYFAYTNLSFWQAYNNDLSAPFRETNHEPEAFLIFENDWELFGWRNSLVQIGLNHQSNGRGGSLSRSWNRLYAQLVFERDKLFVGLKPWYRLPEDAEDDDNPDIDDYLGYGELWLGYKGGPNIYSMMLRSNSLTGGKHALQLDWSFPLFGRFRGYLQYFKGYGESLIDYDADTHRLGIGLEFTEML
jgi:phospholipase A1